MRPRPISSVLDLAPVIHGGLNYGELSARGLSPQDVLDFSVSVNPMPPHVAVLKAAREADVSRYPDRSCGALRAALSDLTGVDPSSILVTNGASQAIWLTASVFLCPGRKTAIVSPAYGEYAQASVVRGAVVELWNARSVMMDQASLPAFFGKKMTKEVPDLLWICSPNNPTGYVMDRDQVEALLNVVREAPTLIVVDEAYRNFLAAPPDLTPLLASGQLLLLRSMTKDYGLPGVRLGYVLGASDAVAAMETVQPDWSVSAQAQAVGLALLRHGDHYRAQWAELRCERARLVRELMDRGVTVCPGEANFILCRHPESARLIENLRDRGIMLRDCRSFGLDGWFRIGVKAREDNERLLAEIDRFLNREE